MVSNLIFEKHALLSLWFDTLCIAMGSGSRTKFDGPFSGLGWVGPGLSLFFCAARNSLLGIYDTHFWGTVKLAAAAVATE